MREQEQRWRQLPHRGTSTRRGTGGAKSPWLPLGAPALGRRSRWHVCPDPGRWTWAPRANQGRQPARAHCQFSGSTEVGGHLIRGPDYGTRSPAAPEPSPGLGRSLQHQASRRRALSGLSLGAGSGEVAANRTGAGQSLDLLGGRKGAQASGPAGGLAEPGPQAGAPRP